MINRGFRNYSWFGLDRFQIYSIYSRISIVLGHVYSMWETSVRFMHLTSHVIPWRNNAKQMSHHNGRMSEIHTTSYKWYDNISSLQFEWKPLKQNLWYKTNTIFSNMKFMLLYMLVENTYIHVIVTMFIIFNFHQKNNEKCENYNQSGPKMWHWTIPPLNSHILTSETQKASFLYGKYEHSEGIVSSHILDDIIIVLVWDNINLFWKVDPNSFQNIGENFILFSVLRTWFRDFTVTNFDFLVTHSKE